MDYKKAAAYWTKEQEETVQMNHDMLYSYIEEFIEAHNTCSLATGSGDFVRCTPIEYSYKDGKLWMLTEGGLKFYALENNKNVCLAIYDSYTGFANLGGMQITGVAEMIEPWTKDYLDLLAYKKLNAESLKKLPNTLYLIKIFPTHIDYLNSKFKKMGFAARQQLNLI